MEASENVVTADNQQERLDAYFAGYVDGEGSFHVAVQRNPSCRLGIQLVPELHVSQNEERSSVLEVLRERLGCGYIKPNHRSRSNDRSQVFVVRNREDLTSRVIPFFQRNPLLSSKQDDFVKFSAIVTGLIGGRHRTKEGLAGLLEIAFSMNGGGRYRKLSLGEILSGLESSETIRRTSRQG